MKKVRLCILLVSIFSKSVYCAEENRKKIIYTMTSMQPFTGNPDYYLKEVDKVTSITLKKYDTEFKYSITYTLSDDPSQIKKISVESSFYIPSKGDQIFSLVLNKKIKEPKYIDDIIAECMWLPIATKMEEKKCDLINLEEWDKKIDFPVYGSHLPATDPTEEDIIIDPIKIILLGKCPIKGYLIYEIVCGKNKERIKIPNPFLLFSRELIDAPLNKDFKRMNIIFKEESRGKYFMNISKVTEILSSSKEGAMCASLLMKYAKK